VSFGLALEIEAIGTTFLRDFVCGIGSRFGLQERGQEFSAEYAFGNWDTLVSLFMRSLWFSFSFFLFV
jgi:hypothetical protein